MEIVLLCSLLAWIATKACGHEDVANSESNFTLGTEPSKDRVWNFVKGQFELIEPSEVKKTELVLDGDWNLKKKRKRRAAPASKLRDTKTLELAVYIDQEMWDLYVEKYGSADAEPRLRIFVGTMLNQTRVLYQHSSLSPRLEITVQRIEIWKTQPEPLRNIGNGLDYVDKFCSYVRPKSSGFDHASLISGNRLQVGLDIDGIAWQDSICTDSSCTVVRGAYNTAYRHGNTLAHEMGHSLGMAHDGTGASRTCDENCCIMAPKQTGTVWSSCSKTEYQRTLLSTDCLEDDIVRSDSPIMQGPISSLPGQVFPDEAQCHQIVGTCYRSVPGHEGECDKQYCTRHQDSSIMTTISEFRLDGSYCGPGKVCDGGSCVRVDAARRNQMYPINGGWSAWRSDAEDSCGGGECSDCEIGDQVSVRAEVRRCDSPYPNNGGTPCLGSQIRGALCSGANNPWRCRLNRSRYQSRMDYMEATCKDHFSGLRGTGVLYEREDVGCDFICYNKFAKDEAPKRFPDGTSCGTQAAPGKCVSGVCMFPKCRNNPDLFVASESDCL